MISTPSSPDELRDILARLRAGSAELYLQTAVLAAPAERCRSAVDVLASAGITQVAAAGAAAARFFGLPHEGEYALRRLGRLVGIDLGAGPLVDPNRDEQAARGIAASLSRERLQSTTSLSSS